MNELVTDRAVMEMPSIAPQTVQQQNSKDDIMQVMLDSKKYGAIYQLAEIISKNNMLPNHLHGNIAVCFQIVLQSLELKINPFVMAQKTYEIKGKLGYESQLIIALINSNAPIKHRLKFEYFGDWDGYINSGLQKSFEATIGVKCFTTFVNEEEPSVMVVKMSSIGIRNSTNWKNDPKQQIAYVAAQRWGRLNAPDVMMGFYSPDELEVIETPKEKSINKAVSKNEQLKELIAPAKKEESKKKKTTKAKAKAEPVKEEPSLLEKEKAKEEEKPVYFSALQRKKIFNRLVETGVTQAELQKRIQAKYGVSETGMLLQKDFDDVMELCENNGEVQEDFSLSSDEVVF